MVANAWDGGTMGAKAALENLGFGAGDVKLVGFDGAGDAIAAMDDGWVHANTAQMLYQMGLPRHQKQQQQQHAVRMSLRGSTLVSSLSRPRLPARNKAMVGIE